MPLAAAGLTLLATPPMLPAQVGTLKTARMDNVVLALYPENSLQPSGIFKAKRLFRDHQRRGFFRIGVLPMLACEDVTFEVNDGAAMARALGRVREEIAAHAPGLPIELRRVTFTFAGESSPRLTAPCVRLRDNGTWEMEQAALLQDGVTNRLARASLQTTGAASGELNWTAPAGPARLNLFDPAAPFSSFVTAGGDTQPAPTKPPRLK